MRTSTLLSTLLVVLPISSQCFGENKIEWLRSAQEAADVAQRTGRPILVYVRSANCHYCDLMQREVWQDAKTVARVKRDFVPLKLTREENGEEVQVMQVKGFPATLVFNSERRFAHRVDGYVEPEKFQAELDKAEAAAKSVRISKRQ